jgi:4-hydroxy-2-oxoheptanedioate aldolase
MAAEQLRKTLNAGLPAFAAWVSIGDSFSAEALGGAGYDSLILDAQHGGITWDNLGRMLQAMDLSRTPGLVRVPSIEPAGIMRALDLGAAGVIVPMVSNEAQARLAAQAVRYPPHGMRSFGMVRNYYGTPATTHEPLCWVMIETAEAMDNLDAIAAVPGVDGLFIGPVDLALSLGLGPVLELQDPVVAAIERVVSACRRHGKFSGSASMGLPYARALIDRGVRFIAQGSDLGFLRRGAKTELDVLRAWRDDCNKRQSIHEETDRGLDAV